MRDLNFRPALLVGVAALALAGCSPSPAESAHPELAERGTTMTTAKLSRQDLTSTVSLSGKVTMNPVFGLVAPVDGQVRYFTVKRAPGTSSTPTQVANVWANGVPHAVSVPSGATLAGQLVDDKSAVTEGMPIVSANHVGYGIVADIEGDQAYRLSDSLKYVKAQIKNGPGPFKCAVLGTIAALPEGALPAEPEPRKAENTKEPVEDGPPPPGAFEAVPGEVDAIGPDQENSEPTGMRLVCTAPSGVKMINGADATIQVVTARASKALVAPVEAVAGSTGEGKVDVISADGRRTTKTVVLGLTDGKVIEIKSGLKGDETLAVPGPNLPPAGGMGGPEGPGVRHGG